jgi:hypothetical protein
MPLVLVAIWLRRASSSLFWLFYLDEILMKINTFKLVFQSLLHKFGFLLVQRVSSFQLVEYSIVLMTTATTWCLKTFCMA